jgi:hypothetical protein
MPPFTHFNIPTIETFQPGGNEQGGRRPGRGRGGRAPVIVPGGCQAPRTPFADYSVRQVGKGASIVPAFVPGVPGVGAAARNTAPMYSNIAKRYSNMNVCFLCSFDVENGQTSRTCPQAWRRANHQEAYDRSNAQQYINAGYDLCTKAKHKTQLPNFWRCGAEPVDNHKCNHDILTDASDPNKTSVNNSNDATVITSNRSRARNIATALRQGVPKVLAFADTHTIASRTRGPHQSF